jgi:cell division protein FtsB
MSDARRRGWARVAAVAVLTLGAVYAFQLASLALATRQARRIEAAERAQVAQLATQVAALETATHDAGTDAYVERWARENRKWARPGDHVLAPVAATPVLTPTPVAVPPAGESPLDRFWRWLSEQ